MDSERTSVMVHTIQYTPSVPNTLILAFRILCLVMSVPLWNLSSGSIVHLSGFSSIINSAFALDREVSHAQCRNQLGQCAIACDLAEAALGFEHAGGSPSEDHRATLPAFHPARDLTHSTEQVLDQIGR